MSGWAGASGVEIVERDATRVVAVARPDEGWRQGPGVYGGLTGAALARTAQLLAPGRPLRSMALQYCAPVEPGPSELVATLDRAGARSTFVSARLLQRGAVQVQALACLALDRPADLDHVHLGPPADLPDPDTLPSTPYLEGVTPVFTQHVDFRFPALRMYSGSDRAHLSAWLRFRDPGVPTMDRPLLVGLLDAMPPALLARADRPRPMSTVTFQLHLLADVERLALPSDAWLHSEVRSQVTLGGYSDEEIVLTWPGAPDPADRVLAVGRQLFALLR